MSNVSLLFDGRCWAAARCRCRASSRCTFQSEVIRGVRQRAGRSRQSSPVCVDHLPEAPALQWLTAMKWMAELASIVFKSLAQSTTLYITFTHSMHIIDIHRCNYLLYISVIISYMIYMYICVCVCVCVCVYLSVHISLYALYTYAVRLSSRMSVQLY